MRRNWVRGVCVAGLCMSGWLAGAWAQAGIYACTTKKGQVITADRPIAECVDREQRELNPSGTVRRTIGPSLTVEERAAREAKERHAAQEQARLDEEKRRDRALLTRYPSLAVHEKERESALQQLDDVMRAAQKRVEDLIEQRKTINAEFEFYKRNPAKAPPTLKRQLDENTQHQQAQRRFIADQEREKKRVNARFDEEGVKLRPLWAGAVPVRVPPGDTARAP